MISNLNLRAHRITGLEPGLRLIVTGAVHGNETAGTQGIRQVLNQIDRSEIEIARGSVTFVPVCNPLAYNQVRRMGDRNLNRRLQPKRPDDPTPQDNEDRIARVLCGWLAEHASNVYPVGRNGMFRYNNQDHSMFTAMLTVENIATGTNHDVWEVNVEEEYHEEATSSVKEKFIAEKAGERAPGSHGTGRDAPVIKREVIDAHKPATSSDPGTEIAGETEA